MLRTNKINLKVYQIQLTHYMDSWLDLVVPLEQLWKGGEVYGKEHIVKKETGTRRVAIFKLGDPEKKESNYDAIDELLKEAREIAKDTVHSRS